MTRRTLTPDELRELAKDRGPFFADTARAALIYCADVKAAADEAIQEASRKLAAAEARNATLTDDAARLDFIEKAVGCHDLCQWGAYGYTFAPRLVSYEPIIQSCFPNIRALADAAIQARAAMKEKTP